MSLTVKTNLLELGDLSVFVRKDGYVNVTNLCLSAGKRFNTWRRKKETLSVLEAFQSAQDKLIHPSKPILEIGKKRMACWAAPQLAVAIATWCNPEIWTIVTQTYINTKTGDQTMHRVIDQGRRNQELLTQEINQNENLKNEQQKMYEDKLKNRVQRKRDFLSSPTADLTRNELGDFACDRDILDYAKKQRKNGKCTEYLQLEEILQLPNFNALVNKNDINTNLLTYLENKLKNRYENGATILRSWRQLNNKNKFEVVYKPSPELILEITNALDTEDEFNNVSLWQNQKKLSNQSNFTKSDNTILI